MCSSKKNNIICDLDYNEKNLQYNETITKENIESNSFKEMTPNSHGKPILVIVIITYHCFKEIMVLLQMLYLFHYL